MYNSLQTKLDDLLQVYSEIIADADEYGQKQEWWDGLRNIIDDIEEVQQQIELEKS